jgi:hypothetical protein
LYTSYKKRGYLRLERANKKIELNTKNKKIENIIEKSIEKSTIGLK